MHARPLLTLTALALASTAHAQTTISGVAFAQLTTTAGPPNVANPAAASVPPGPNTAYGNLTNNPRIGFGTSTGNRFSDVWMDDITVAPSAVGQRVQSIRIACYYVAGSNPATANFTGRVQVAFWNGDGTGVFTPGGPTLPGTAGTPLLRPDGTQAAYVTNSFGIASPQFGLLTLNLGDQGFTLPAGKFYIALAFEGTGPTTSGLGIAPGRYFAPAIGSSDPGLANGGSDFPSGMPFGTTFAPGGPNPPIFDSPTNGGLGVELLIPSPSTATTLAASLSIFSRRRRR